MTVQSADPYHQIGYLQTVLDLAHHALREVDASDQSAPQTIHTLDRVSVAVGMIEGAARKFGFTLSEMKPTEHARASSEVGVTAGGARPGARKTPPETCSISAAELRDVLAEIIEYSGGAENALADEYVMDRARTVLAQARGDAAR